MSAIRDTLVIARRELDERVRSKWFVIMTLLGPLFMVALVVVPAVIAVRGVSGARVEILDRSGTIGAPLAEALNALSWRATVVPPDTAEAIELARIRDDQINGFLLVPEDALARGAILYRGDNASSQAVAGILKFFVTQVVQRQRATSLQLTPAQTEGMLAMVDFQTQHTTGEQEGSSGMGAFAIAYALALILYMVIMIYGVAVMRSVVQEKTSRVMEFLVAAVKPRSLMAGKILGIGGAALIQLTVWLGIGAIALAYRTELLGMFGVPGGGVALPPLAFVEVTVVLLYFILGFFFYAAMYAAVGAMVSSEQDTQQVQLPVTMLLVIGVICLQVISNDPRGGMSSAMTIIPFWSPLLMPMRFVLGGATGAEVALSLGVLVVSTTVVVRLAAKIYRVGVLMYGKRPSLRELLRWVRY